MGYLKCLVYYFSVQILTISYKNASQYVRIVYKYVIICKDMCVCAHLQSYKANIMPVTQTDHQYILQNTQKLRSRVEYKMQVIEKRMAQLTRNLNRLLL